jgi:protein-S-isoprenylcysteine O-methyltransferase Ste14
MRLKDSPIVVVLALVFLIVRGAVLSSSPFVIAAQLIAVALAFWARASFAKGQMRAGAAPADLGLIVRGPYRFIRHPMYAATLLFIWACILGRWSWVNAIAGVLVLVTIAFRIPYEERLLRERYPEYADYARGTRRLVPGVY